MSTWKVINSVIGNGKHKNKNVRIKIMILMLMIMMLPPTLVNILKMLQVIYTIILPKIL